MLLIHPIREVGRFIPALAGILLAGASSGHQWWSLLAVVAVMALSVIRWFTTRYRITPEQVQLRTGLVRRRTMTTPADRIRSVDVTAHALHRMLGLARVAIGTGTSDRKREGLVLDGLSAKDAGALRAELLHRAEPAPTGIGSGVANEQLLAELDPRWLRYAPFTLSGVVTAVAVLGLLWRIINQAQLQADRVSAVRQATRHLRDTPLWLDVLQVAAGALIAVALLSILGYLLAFWNFRLTRHPGGTLHVSRGLITSRATSIAEHRLRGVELSQLLPLRAVGGARLVAVATGLRIGRGAERGGTLLMPACPNAEAVRVGGLVLTGPGAPMLVPLRAHGRQARRRRLVRALTPAVAAWLVLIALWLLAGLPGVVAIVAVLLPLLALLLAQDRYRSLGHELVGRYLVTQWGSLHRRRAVLDVEGIIGWNLRQSYFQRRAGLATLTATTAAGKQSYPVTDLPVGAALQLAGAVMPGVLSQFLDAGVPERQTA
jgi:putative membrane protein